MSDNHTILSGLIFQRFLAHRESKFVCLHSASGMLSFLYDFIYEIEDFDLFCKEMTDLGYKLNINCFIYQLSILLRNTEIISAFTTLWKAKVHGLHVLEFFYIVNWSSVVWLETKETLYRFREYLFVHRQTQKISKR